MTAFPNDRTSRARNLWAALPTGTRVLRIVWPFLVVVILLLLLGGFSLDVLSAVRAYVGCEGLWSKAQKDAVYYLNRYADTRSESDYRKFLDAIAVPLGDRKAREELDKPRPDLAVAREGFIEGRNHPDDIDGMIMLFRRFRHVESIARAIAIWAESDGYIARLQEVGERLHREIQSGGVDAEDLKTTLQRIDDLNARLTPLEEAFSSTLAAASRDTRFRLLLGASSLTVLLFVLGVVLSRRMQFRSEEFERALRSNEERFNLAVIGSNDGLWDWNLASNQIYLSPRAKELMGYADHELPNEPATVVSLLHPDDRPAVREALKAHLKFGNTYDQELRLRSKSGDYRWYRARGRSVRNTNKRAIRMAGSISDITDRKLAETQLFAEKERAQVTLESIGDAVITTNVKGLVEYLNPVAERLTGWSASDAKGLPVDTVCQVLDETTRDSVPGPVGSVLRDGCVASAVPSALLLRPDGTEIAVHETAAPIRNRAGAVTGVVLVLRDVRREREYASQLSYQASHDALTGLINRREFEHRLDLALAGSRESGRHHAMLYLDLDQFKVVNDTSGHAAGDELMRQISLILGARIREGDSLARLGGDEFGVLLENCPPEPALRIAEELRQTVTDFQFVWHERPFPIGVSMGLVNILDTTMTLADVLSAGDSACYMAKEKGRNRVQVYHPKDTDLALRHGEMEWVGRIRSALDSNRLCLYVQNILAVDRPESAATLYELMVRMVDEDGQLVPPMAFIPAAERYNLMPAVDRWVVRAAFGAIAGRNMSERANGAATYMINLSGTSISDERFLDYVRAEFTRYSFAPGAICFEITETAAIANLGKASHFIDELRALGCRISLDDFGAGMSSFRYLKHLPVDYLKIDGSFVLDMLNDPIDSAMVEAIHRLGRVMGKKTIAEFVENRAVLDRLREIGVDYAQGFGLAKPVPFSPATDAGDHFIRTDTPKPVDSTISSDVR